MSDVKLTERIGKLLRQAENTDNENESAVFMEKAQALATANSIDLAKARHSQTRKERTVPITRHVVLGKRGTRGLNTYVALISGIASANDVRLNIAHNSTYVNLFGYEEDIDVVEALYASLNLQMVQASQAFKKLGTWKEDTVYKSGGFKYFYVNTGKPASERAAYSYYGPEVRSEFVPGHRVPVPWLSARLDFQNAFAHRVGARLYSAKREAELTQTLADAGPGEIESSGTELVLVEKRKTVADFFNSKSNHRGSYRGGRSGVSSNVASAAGRSAGDRARLSNSTSIGGVRGSISA